MDIVRKYGPVRFSRIVGIRDRPKSRSCSRTMLTAHVKKSTSTNFQEMLRYTLESRGPKLSNALPYVPNG